MKVFAQYFEEKGMYFRNNTILQFGDSWELIGSIVLINPGSASPDNKEIHVLDMEKLSAYDSSQPGCWHLFRPDATMYQIEKIFNGSYIGKKVELNGIVRLHNVFNLVNPDLSKALFQVKGIDSPWLFSDKVHEQFSGRPVYLGWTWRIIADIRLEQAARTIFENMDVERHSFYDKEFTKNAFYHPRYINITGYKQPKIQEILTRFFSLLY